MDRVEDDKRFRAACRILELETLVNCLSERLHICSRLLSRCAERGKIQRDALPEFVKVATAKENKGIDQ